MILFEYDFLGVTPYLLKQQFWKIQTSKLNYLHRSCVSRVFNMKFNNNFYIVSAFLFASLYANKYSYGKSISELKKEWKPYDGLVVDNINIYYSSFFDYKNFSIPIQKVKIF